MKTITFEDIKALNIDAQTYYDWIDFPLRNRDKFTLPTKVKIPMVGDDYCNIMPCAFPDGNVLGLKVINRNENRRNDGRINLDSQILYTLTKLAIYYVLWTEIILQQCVLQLWPFIRL